MRASKKVGWHTHVSGDVTARNVPSSTYVPALDADGTSVDVFGWAPTQTLEPNETRVDVELDLFVPTALGGPRDVVDIPALGRFEVVGHPQDFSSGPFSSRFGAVVKLKRTQQ